MLSSSRTSPSRAVKRLELDAPERAYHVAFAMPGQGFGQFAERHRPKNADGSPSSPFSRQGSDTCQPPHSHRVARPGFDGAGIAGQRP